MPKIKVEKELYNRIKDTAEAAGYSSADEFVVHLLEKIVSQSDEDDEILTERLRGLGYIS